MTTVYREAILGKGAIFNTVVFEVWSIQLQLGLLIILNIAKEYFDSRHPLNY